MTDYNTYKEMKMAFIKKHHGDFTIHTSSLDEYNRYHKEYVFTDGAIWYEIMSPETVMSSAEVKGVRVQFEAKLFKTEFWSSDDAQSRTYYEAY